MAEVEADAPDDYAEGENESDDEADLSISERSDRVCILDSLRSAMSAVKDDTVRN